MSTTDEARTDAATREDRVADLYRRHVPSAIAFAYLLTGDRAEAEDLVHEAFVRVIGRLAHLRAAGAFDAYLKRAVVNLRTSRLRRLGVERAFLDRRPRDETSDALPDLERRDELWHALDRLPPRQRAVLVLRYYEDLSERETANVLRCSVSAVKSMTNRALTTLRGTVEREDA